MSARRDRLRRGRRHGGPVKALIILLGVLFTGVVIAGVAGAAYVWKVADDAPSLKGLKPREQGGDSIVYSADGTRLGIIASDILRDEVSSRQIPESVKQATVAVEDRRFFEHGGVDPEGVLRAAVKNVQSGKTVEGGSTLTMQLIRNTYLTDERTWKRKLQEAKLAEELERVHTGIKGKNWVLTKYLNAVPYGTTGGQTAVGVEAASRMYFDKPARDLDLDEAALLAGLPQAPTSYNPFLYPDRAKARRNDVLTRMADQGMISKASAARAKARGLGVKPGNSYYRTRRESYFFDYVKQELIDRYGVATVRQGGMKVRTTIDLRLQQAARKSIADKLAFSNSPSSAIVTIDPSNGYIRAMASSSDYGRSKFNLAAQGHRQPGSTFKVMGLMAALEQGINPATTNYVSRRLDFTDQKYGKIDVQTYGHTYAGTENLVRATLTSDNSVYQQLGLDVGPDKVKRAAREMGIKSPLYGYPGEILGGLKYGVSPLEMANAYATIADGGWRNRPKAITRVTFSDGRVADLSKPARHRAFSDGVTYEATKILEQNVQAGTGTAAQIGCPAAGKTGTTEEFSDAWFVGFTPNLATAVWVGYPGSRVSMRPPTTPITVAGATYPAAIWGEYMKSAKRGCGEFKKPTHPFVSKPFSGKYQRQGAASADAKKKGDATKNGKDGTSTTPGGTQTTPANPGGAAPTAPATPPATPPATQQPAAPTPTQPAAGGTAPNPADYVAPG
jgi:penicillin-binding protein 1A